MLLNTLAEEQKIDPKSDMFKFIGSGFGANSMILYCKNRVEIILLVNA